MLLKLKKLLGIGCRCCGETGNLGYGHDGAYCGLCKIGYGCKYCGDDVE